MVRHHPSDLSRAFYSTRFVRRLDALGYARLKHWRIYGEEGLAMCEVALWLGDDGLVVEYGGETLSRYDVSFSPGETGLDAVTNPRLFATRYRTPQLKFFAIEDVLGRLGRHGLAEGPRAGRARGPVARLTDGAAGSAVLLLRGPLASRGLVIAPTSATLDRSRVAVNRRRGGDATRSVRRYIENRPRAR